MLKKIRRLKNFIFLHLAHLPMPGHLIRPLIVSWGGVNVAVSKKTFIGEGVIFDSLYPESIYVEEGASITMNCVILSHHIDPQTYRFSKGIVRIKKKAFLGAGTIITKSLTVGNGAIVGAGSVVTKDIPDYEVWCGNPARKLKSR